MDFSVRSMQKGWTPRKILSYNKADLTGMKDYLHPRLKHLDRAYKRSLRWCLVEWHQKSALRDSWYVHSQEEEQKEGLMSVDTQRTDVRSETASSDEVGRVEPKKQRNCISCTRARYRLNCEESTEFNSADQTKDTQRGSGDTSNTGALQKSEKWTLWEVATDTSQYQLYCTGIPLFVGSRMLYLEKVNTVRGTSYMNDCNGINKTWTWRITENKKS